MMPTILRGRVWKFGDNVDTDVITPGDTISFGLGDAEEKRILAENAFRAVRPRFHEQVRKGDILVAGRNFGLGSHREPANTALIELGFSAVVAESIARLFFRNSVAVGFHALAVPGITSLVEEGEEIEIDLVGWRVRNLSRGGQLALEPYSPLVRDIIEAGGIIAVLKRHIDEAGLACRH